MVAFPGDDDGLLTELREEAVRAHRPALIYLVPEFQNPRGTTLAQDRRRELAAMATRHGVRVSPSTSAPSPRPSRPGCGSAGSTDRRP